jgi:hypothetical protein
VRPSDPVTLTDVLAFVAGHADDEGLDAITDAVGKRRRVLADIAAVAVTVGAAVRLQNLSPRYFNGLIGTVIDITSLRRGATRRCVVRLDEASTRQLAVVDEYAHLRDATSYDLPGIPARTCHVLPANHQEDNRRPSN